jgi:molybdopterin-guanine dinucleotide biosynthesis protein A
MAGLAAGLAAASHANALVVACDMPFLSTRLLTRLLELVEGCDAAVPLTGAGAEPLHAAYSRECLPTVEALLRLGASSLRDLLPRLRVKYIDEEQCLKLDPDGMSWFNMNNTDDLLFAKHHLGARHPRVAAA